MQFAAILPGHRNRSSVRRSEYNLVLGNDQKTARCNNAAAWKSEIRAVQPPPGKVERVHRGSIVDFDERSVRHKRMVHDLIDDEFVLGQFDCAGVIHVDRRARAADRVAVGVQTLKGERVVASGKRHLRGPI